MKRRSSLPLNPELNLTNMIDVIFAILVVFMITAPLMSQGIKVDLPQAKSASIDEKKSINVTINKDREIIINDIPSDINGFKNDFRSVWTGDQQTIIIVNSDKSVPYGFVMQLVAQAQEEGAKRIGFLTDPSSTTKRFKKRKKQR